MTTKEFLYKLNYDLCLDYTESRKIQNGIAIWGMGEADLITVIDTESEETNVTLNLETLSILEADTSPALVANLMRLIQEYVNTPLDKREE